MIVSHNSQHKTTTQQTPSSQPSNPSSLSLSINPITMNPFSHHRSLLQEEDAARSLRSPAASSFPTTSPFDSSLVLTILVLLTVLFLMAFFSLYIRRFSSHSDGPLSGRHDTPPHFLQEKRDGVDPATVRSLPNFAYGGGGSSNIPGECSICLSEFEERETVTVIPYCRHGFHPMCIERWLLSHVSCPLCRSTQLFPVAGDDLSGDGGGER